MAGIVTIELVQMYCGNCGTYFGLERYHYNTLVREGGGFTCPNGCRRTFRESDADRLRKKLQQAEDRNTRLLAKNDQLRAERDAQERKTRAEKAAKTRIKNRVGNGVCPCCKRQFQNLKRHMQCKHPDYQVES